MKMFKFMGTKLQLIVSKKFCENPMSSKGTFKGIDNITGCGTAEFHNLWIYIYISGKVINDNQVLSFV